MFIQLANGVILTEPGQIDSLLASKPTRIISEDPQKLVDHLVLLAAQIRQEWAADGVPLDQVQIPVQDMFEEIANILERAGCQFDHRLIVGDPRHA